MFPRTVCLSSHTGQWSLHLKWRSTKGEGSSKATHYHMEIFYNQWPTQPNTVIVLGKDISYHLQVATKPL